jgi:hypothetical protein
LFTGHAEEQAIGCLRHCDRIGHRHDSGTVHEDCVTVSVLASKVQ